MGFVDPPLVLTARGRALRGRGAERARPGAARPRSRGALGALDAVAAIEHAGPTPSTARSRAPGGTLHRGGAQPAAVGLLAAAGAGRPLLPRRTSRTSASTAPSATTWRSSSSRSGSGSSARRPARPRAVPARRADRRRPSPRGRASAGATTSRSDGRATDGLPRDGAAAPVRRRRPRRPAPGDHAPGEYAALVRVARESFKRGDLFEVVPGQTFFEPMPVAARRAVPAAARAQPGALRLPHQPRRGRVPGRRLARDVRARRRRPRRDLPDLRHDRARARPDRRRRADPGAPHLGEGRVGADDVHRRRPQRQVAHLRARAACGSSAGARSRCTRG